MRTECMGSFVMYGSVVDAIEASSTGLSASEKGEVYSAIMRYGARGEDAEGLSGAAFAIYTMVCPLIDASKERRKNASKGGRPKKDIDELLLCTDIEMPRKGSNKKTTKADPFEMYEGILAETVLDDDVRVKISDWLEYKTQKGDKYVEKGLKALISEVSNKINELGDKGVVFSQIDRAIASGWKGMNLDKIKADDIPMINSGLVGAFLSD